MKNESVVVTTPQEPITCTFIYGRLDKEAYDKKLKKFSTFGEIIDAIVAFDNQLKIIGKSRKKYTFFTWNESMKGQNIVTAKIKKTSTDSYSYSFEVNTLGAPPPYGYAIIDEGYN
ncbi:MAG: hypothetical protein WCG55_00075 [bacterium]